MEYCGKRRKLNPPAIAVLCDDNWLVIGTFLNAIEIVQFSTVSKECNRLSNVMFLWKYGIRIGDLAALFRLSLHENPVVTLVRNIAAVRVIIDVPNNTYRFWPIVLLGQAFDCAVKDGNASIVKLLLAHRRVGPEHVQHSRLVWAAQVGHVEVVKLLVADGRIAVDGNNNVAFRMACVGGNLETVQFLLGNSRVDPSDCKVEALLFAASHGHLPVVKLLLADSRVQAYPNLPRVMNSAFFYACSAGRMAVAEYLLADPRVVPEYGNNMWLASACLNRNLPAIKLLLADPRVNPDRHRDVILTIVSEDGGGMSVDTEFTDGAGLVQELSK